MQQLPVLQQINAVIKEIIIDCIFLQKILLALCVVLAVSVALSSAQCFTGSLTFDVKTRKTACEHGGQMHQVGTVWTSECQECSCTKRGLSCCSTIKTPVNYDKENCESVFNAESCSYTVTRKDNPSEKCEVMGMVG
ncbi:beta-microseminoprotein-like [Rhinoderma darwinii]|uniref:beta-microseminoprotein-like n=1 Tax=Rhinoderma darwinii TaxID=43563 RepID=UPI003F67E38F